MLVVRDGGGEEAEAACWAPCQLCAPAVCAPCWEAPTGPREFPFGSEDSDTSKLRARHTGSHVTQLAGLREAVGNAGALKWGVALGRPNRTELGCDPETPEFCSLFSAHLQGVCGFKSRSR